MICGVEDADYEHKPPRDGLGYRNSDRQQSLEKLGAEHSVLRLPKVGIPERPPSPMQVILAAKTWLPPKLLEEGEPGRGGSIPSQLDTHVA